VGRCDIRYVQLSAKRLPNQERWLPILAASVLVKVIYVLVGIVKGATRKWAMYDKGLNRQNKLRILEQTGETFFGAALI
jgi:hypothetical protein